MPDTVERQEEPKIAFISGPIEPPAGYFEKHYIPKLNEAIAAGHSFVVGPAPGMDTESLRYLITAGVHPDKITVYLAHFEEKLLASKLQWFVDLGGDLYVEGVTTEARDAAMTRDSDYDILRYMSIEEQKNLYGRLYYPRISQTEKNEIRRRQTLLKKAAPDSA
ncbi:hypothetical protein JR316_0012873 [Psilocybe cubensis]|uniref:Uncharacterized protein n=2 Tax=Psilocybe cubensis TaxID=181762 RepID=A0A8H7XT57_PSICU|nr:hypothetical protein JR316_0012873 [Psilocybe cubensis]KAH9474415.1 hypothetical protein JR316_0012873 [Psilocybe cubensis]